MKWDCEIIQDLIPSYVDEVCSDRSRAVVEEHLQECGVCREMEKQYRATAFSAGKLEEKELNGLKKIRQRMKRQTVISCALGILLVLLGGQAFGGDGYVPRLLYYVLLPVCLFGVYRTGTHTDTRIPAQAADHLLAAGAAVAVAVSVGVMWTALGQALAGGQVLGVPPENAGPTLAAIWAACFAVQLLLFAALWYRQHALHVENRFRMGICITGMFLLLAYVEALRNLESVKVVKHTFLQMSVVVFLLGAGGVCLICRLAKKENASHK